MAFFDAHLYSTAVFPLEAKSLSVTPSWNTRVVQTRSGAKQKSSEWSDGLRRYDAAMGVRTLADAKTLIRHFNAMRGRRHGFPLLDRTGYTATTEAFGTGDGVTTTFTLRVDDGNAANAYQREIYKPATVSAVYENGVLHLTPAGYTVNLSTGVVTFTTPPANTAILTWTGTFYVPVEYEIDRLTIDMFVWKDGGAQLVHAPDVPMVETRSIS